MNGKVIREKLHQQIDALPDEVIKQIADFTFTLSQCLRKEDEVKDTESSASEHTAFGIWADHPEAVDPVAYAVNLRRQVELREDATTYKTD